MFMKFFSPNIFQVNIYGDLLLLDQSFNQLNSFSKKCKSPENLSQLYIS